MHYVRLEENYHVVKPVSKAMRFQTHCVSIVGSFFWQCGTDGMTAFSCETVCQIVHLKSHLNSVKFQLAKAFGPSHVVPARPFCSKPCEPFRTWWLQKSTGFWLRRLGGYVLKTSAFAF